MQRICVVGCSGAGKSTFCRRLSDITKLPHVSLDGHYWQAGWVTPSGEVWRAIHRSLIERECWIIDGTFYSTMEERLEAADTVIFMDYPRLRCVWRILRRTVRWWRRNRPEMADGCQERFDFDFLKYVWRFHQRDRPGVVAAIEKRAKDRRVYVLTNDREAEAVLRQFAQD